MREHDLQLFRDVEVAIVDMTFNREDAEKVESFYINLYEDTILNKVKVDTRKYNTDPRYRRVLNVTTGYIYWAVKPVLDEFGMSRYLLEKSIVNKAEICGCVFEWVE